MKTILAIAILLPEPLLVWLLGAGLVALIAWRVPRHPRHKLRKGTIGLHGKGVYR